MNTNFTRHEKNSKDIDTINVLIPKKVRKTKIGNKIQHMCQKGLT